ncbi:lipocalin-like domain-containing protein [Segatella oris]|uniref:Lipoprotein n=1 Tax=Segatella oris C735 TaxID=563008 RepID=D7N9C8_9BACT|nr:hypothetical protein [Segatella oris]EFI49535.1 lipoprotein [Segatella oris C735]
MKKLFYFGVILLIMMSIVACKHRQSASNVGMKDSMEDVGFADTTVYGVCGENTSMHNIELITDLGDTLEYTALDDGRDSTVILGGLLSGDRLAVIGHEVDGERFAQRVINLTTLLGKWVSIDRNFEILEGGQIKSNVKAETNPWTVWKICNGKLLLNKDTFMIDNLGADSLYIENKEGIFAFKRVK